MPQIIRSHKYRLYPNDGQKSTLAQFFGAKRYIFNHYLNENQERFRAEQQHLSNFDINKDITQLKRLEGTAWLKGIDDWALKHAAEDLSTAYNNFFKSIKGKSKAKSKPPKFKSRKDKQSYRTRKVKIDFKEQLIKLPKIGKVKLKIHKEFVGTVKSATISKDPDGKYYVSILVQEEYNPKNCTHSEIGIDLGLKELLILSNGIVFSRPKQERTNLAIKRNQKKLSRKTYGSKNYEKQRLKLAKLSSYRKRRQDDYYHNISSYIVTNYSAIYMENLSSSNMMKNRKLSKAIHDISWYKLKSMIEYKAMWNYRTFHQIDRFYPSSKLCSSCGHKHDSLTLNERGWACLICGTHHDRDLNAAINILYKGQIDLYNQVIKTSQATGEKGALPPVALQKMTTKIEGSLDIPRVGHGSGQAQYSGLSG
jgi:putative transposase